MRDEDYFQTFSWKANVIGSKMWAYLSATGRPISKDFDILSAIMYLSCTGYVRLSYNFLSIENLRGRLAPTSRSSLTARSHSPGYGAFCATKMKIPKGNGINSPSGRSPRAVYAVVF